MLPHQRRTHPLELIAAVRMCCCGTRRRAPSTCTPHSCNQSSCTRSEGAAVHQSPCCSARAQRALCMLAAQPCKACKHTSMQCTRRCQQEQEQIVSVLRAMTSAIKWTPPSHATRIPREPSFTTVQCRTATAAAIMHKSLFGN